MKAGIMNKTQATRNDKLAASPIRLPSCAAPIVKKTADTVNSTHPANAKPQDDRALNATQSESKPPYADSRTELRRKRRSRAAPMLHSRYAEAARNMPRPTPMVFAIASFRSTIRDDEYTPCAISTRALAASTAHEAIKSPRHVQIVSPTSTIASAHTAMCTTASLSGSCSAGRRAVASIRSESRTTTSPNRRRRKPGARSDSISATLNSTTTRPSTPNSARKLIGGRLDGRTVGASTAVPCTGRP